MAALAALLARLPDTVLEQFRDASFTNNFRTKNAQLFSGTSWVDLDDLQAWLRQRGDIDLLHLDSNLPFDPRSMDGSDVFIQNAAFDGYPAVGFDETRSATPSSSYSYSHDDYQSSNYSLSGSEFNYLDASGLSTPYSGLDLFGEDISDSNLDWDPSLAAFFYSAEKSNQPPNDLSFAAALPFNSESDTAFPPGVASGSYTCFFSENIPPSHLQVPDPATVASGSGVSLFSPNTPLSHLQVPDPTDAAAFLPPPQENFKFEEGNPRLMTQEEMDAAGEAWPWVPSNTVWLDKDVWSDVYVPPYPIPVTTSKKVSRIERVHGIPSQFPVPRVSTAFLVDFSSIRDACKNDDVEMLRLDKILKEKDCHSWDGTPGERGKNRAPTINGQLFASVGSFSSVQCRRSRQLCQGIHYCKSIDASLIDVERYELDPLARDAVNNAQIVQRQNQGSRIQDKVICYVNTVKTMKCTAKNASGGACGGYQVLKEAAKELPSGRKYYFACSNHSSSWTNHSGIQIPPDVDEDLCIRGFRGESIVDDSTNESCSRIIGSGSGKKGKSQCPFPHTKDGKAYVAPMCKRTCEASITFYVPLEEDKIPLVVVVPKIDLPHTHPPPPATKVPTNVKLLYENAVRAFGVSIATVNKVEQAASTIQIMGAAPALVHPSLLQATTKQAIISALKRREPGGDKSGWEGLFDLYQADQAKEPRERYMHSFDFLPGRSPPSAVITTFDNFLLGCVKDVRSLDQDTTFKRMKAGLLNEYELTAFFNALNRLFTFGRIYMDAKDADAFEFAWDKINEAFYGATGKHLSFKAWDPEGWLVTVSGDMEAAPWIGMARSFIKRMDSDKRPTVDEFLAKVVRVCTRHALSGLQKSVKPHVDEDQWTRFQRVLSLKTRQEVHDFGDWVFSLNIAPITAWWNHKINHKWLLPGLLECLSGLSHDDWMTTPFTSNGNETQHHWTNTQTGIGLGARECILRAKQADQAVGHQFEASLASGVMASNRNELSHRTTRNVKRHTSAVEKAKQASAANNKIKELRAELAILVAESKTSSSGVVRITQKSKAQSIAKAATQTTARKKKIPAAGELEGIQMASQEAPIPSDVLQRENVDEGTSQDELTGPANAPDDDAMAIYSEDAELGVPSLDPIAPSAPSPPPPRSESPAPSSTRRSTRKRGASTTHDDAPAPKLKKTEATIAPEASTSVKKRGKRKTKPWSVRHTDDKIYTSFEFLAQFPEEYRVLYGDTLPA
ncbi:hypothetical protein C8F04DRAFT_1235480 [Mycena alexandri]|uniref:Uncharacterized protein n=1 Tax=Mycena alexandri TaxID=1745969 RepID=A0AAD6SQR2_9AGAR|nr:hypothetical protein C8F04DRAFT_1235480 [Mycena alexandri]